MATRLCCNWHVINFPFFQLALLHFTQKPLYKRQELIELLNSSDLARTNMQFRMCLHPQSCYQTIAVCTLTFALFLLVVPLLVISVYTGRSILALMLMPCIVLFFLIFLLVHHMDADLERQQNQVCFSRLQRCSLAKKTFRCMSCSVKFTKVSFHREVCRRMTSSKANCMSLASKRVDGNVREAGPAVIPPPGRSTLTLADSYVATFTTIQGLGSSS